MDYATLSLDVVRSELRDVARDAQDTFGDLDAARLNWRPDATRWSIAQCLEHLLTSNRLMLRAAESALGDAPRTVWQRVPLLPRLVGRVMIRSLAPEATRRFTAPARSRPTASEIPGDIVQRFVDQHREAVEWMQTLDEGRAARTVMISPFARFVPYSVLDGCRLVLAHDRRHIQQARRVMQSREFPSAALAR